MNGHPKLWHCETPNQRGRLMEEHITDLDLKVLNLKNTPFTYERPSMGSSNIDVTLATADIGSRVKCWSVLNVTDSDHKVLMYQVTGNKNRERPTDDNVRFCTKQEDWDAFRVTLISLVAGLVDHPGVSVRASELTEAIKQAAVKSIPVIKPVPSTRRPPSR